MYERIWTNLSMFWCFYMYYICVGFFNEFSLATGRINIYWLKIKRNSCINQKFYIKYFFKIPYWSKIEFSIDVQVFRRMLIRLLACLIWLSTRIHINSYWCEALKWCIPSFETTNDRLCFNANLLITVVRISVYSVCKLICLCVWKPSTFNEGCIFYKIHRHLHLLIWKIPV